MIVSGIYYGATLKSVRVDDIDPTDTDDELVALAIREACESRASLFGWDVRRGYSDGYEGRHAADVRLYID